MDLFDSITENGSLPECMARDVSVCLCLYVCVSVCLCLCLCMCLYVRVCVCLCVVVMWWTCLTSSLRMAVCLSARLVSSSFSWWPLCSRFTWPASFTSTSRTRMSCWILTLDSCSSLTLAQAPTSTLTKSTLSLKASDASLTNTHPFNDPLSRTTCLSRYQKGKTNLDFTEANDSKWQWHQLGHIQVCTSLQTDNHAGTPPLSFLQSGCPSCRPANSVKALKALSVSFLSYKKTICCSSNSERPCICCHLLKKVENINHMKYISFTL